MANPKLSLSSKKFNEVLQNKKVREALKNKADRVLPRSKAIAYSLGASGFAEALHVVEGTRPGTRSPSGLKRPYARVVATVTPQLKRTDGRTSLTRTQILRRGSLG